MRAGNRSMAGRPFWGISSRESMFALPMSDLNGKEGHRAADNREGPVQRVGQLSKTTDRWWFQSPEKKHTQT